jgi:hypothetical protein
VAADGMSARLGAALARDDLDAEVLPAVADLFNAIIARDLPAPDPQTLLDLFDHGIPCTAEVPCPPDVAMCDIPLGATEGTCTCEAEACDGRLAGDAIISADELRVDDLLGSILTPDVDLFDAAGNFNPRVDGVMDSISLGVGLDLVPASF